MGGVERRAAGHSRVNPRSGECIRRRVIGLHYFLPQRRRSRGDASGFCRRHVAPWDAHGMLSSIHRHATSHNTRKLWTDGEESQSAVPAEHERATAGCGSPLSLQGILRKHTLGRTKKRKTLKAAGLTCALVCVWRGSRAWPSPPSPGRYVQDNPPVSPDSALLYAGLILHSLHRAQQRGPERPSIASRATGHFLMSETDGVQIATQTTRACTPAR